MLLLLLAAPLALIGAPLLGGRYRSLARLRFRWVWLVAAALAIQVAIITVLPGPRNGIRVLAHIGSYLLAGVFLFVNRRIPGLLPIAVGAGLNLLAIVANGGVMPASPEALAAAGMATDDPSRFANSMTVEGARLAFLGDVFAVPASWPLSGVFSAGDVLIALGVALTILRAAGSRPRLSRRRAASSDDPRSLAR